MSAATMPAKPTPLQVQPENIPEELKALEQWVIWRYEAKDGRWTKVPYQSRHVGARASSTNPKTWGGFEDALASYQAGRSDGVGLVLVGSDPYTAIDLDNCRDPVKLTRQTWAAEIISAVDSYTEVSPSGTGFRIFAKGRLRLDEEDNATDRKRSKVGDFEIYDGLKANLEQGGRYVTVTGYRVQGEAVNERQSELEQIYDAQFAQKEKASQGTKAKAGAKAAPNLSDDELLEKARNSKGGEKFAALFDRGDTSDYARDDNEGASEADLALCCKLAFWTDRDPAWMDRLFRQSALYREKWERTDYAQRTIEAAIQRTPEGYKGKKKKRGGSSKSKGAAKQRPQPDYKGEGDTSTDDYAIHNGVICRVKLIKKDKELEEEYKPLCNFTARITEQVTRDDGAERSSLFTIEGTAQDGRAFPRAEIPTNRFAAMSWPVDEWGNDAVVYAGQGNKDHLRAAIQLLSIGKAERRTVYTHTGWREVGADVYLHAGGATGKDGTQGAVQVELSGDMRHFALPEVPVSDAVKNAVCKSLALLDLAPDRITAPLLAAPYRAVLGEADFGLHLAGDSGAFKTQVAALIQQHFGAEMDARHLPGSWSSTANALEGLLWQGKDAVTVIDDFKPTGSQHDVARYHAAAERVLRAGANHSARRRMKSDGTLCPDHPPRSLIVSTGEDIPKGTSLRARTLILEVQKETPHTPGDVNKDKLTAAQAEARAGTYATALAGFIRYLAEDFPGHKQRFNELHLAERDSLHATLPRDAHPRTADIGGQLLATWEVILEYVESVQALTAEEAAAMHARVCAAILEALRPQKQHQSASDPATRFIDLMGALLSSGKAHVATPDGEYPGEGYGWRKGEDGYQRPQGTRIGWLSGSELWLEPDVAYAEASELARKQNDSISVAEQTLWKRLAERGIIRTEGKSSAAHNKIKKTVEGNRRRVIILGAYMLEKTGATGAEDDEQREEQDNSRPGSEKEPGRTGAADEKPGHKERGRNAVTDAIRPSCPGCPGKYGG